LVHRSGNRWAIRRAIPGRIVVHSKCICQWGM